MKTFTLNEKTYDLPESWNEISLKRYINIAKLEEQRKDFFLGELYLLKMIEALCDVEDGELDELTLDVVNDISEALKFLQAETEWPVNKFVEIEGTIYVFPADLNKLTMGEYISIKTFQENSQTQADALPYILSVVLRPGRLEKNEETGEEKWVQDKFTANNIEYRRELFMKHPVIDLMGPINFFLGGNK
jgi:hypothetical protein